MSNSHPNANTQILIQPSSWKTRSYDARAEERARRLIRDEVLLKRNEPYYQVRASITYATAGAHHMVAYLLRANTYTADVIEIAFDEDFELTGIREGTDVADEEQTSSTAKELGTGYADVDFVVATPVPDIPTALKAVEDIAQIAEAAGLRVLKLIGPDASVGAYQGALASGVRAFFNVGHGYTGGIVLADGNLTHSWFSGLAGRPVSPAVVYFNSCQVFNQPLQPAVMASGARTFVGGIVNLLIGPSEKVATCFWRKVLQEHAAMGAGLQVCEQANYPTQGAHGIAGDLGPFGIASIKEVAKDPVKDVRRDPVVDTVKEIRKEPTIDTLKEIRKEPIRDTVKEIRKEPTIDTLKEIRKEPIRDTVKEVTGDPTIAETVIPPGPGPLQPGQAVPFVMAGGSAFGGGGGLVASGVATTDVQMLAEAIIALEQQHAELVAAYDAAVQAMGGSAI